MVQFPVCDRCNARCVMCHRWRKDGREEISAEKIREVFSGSLFSRVEEVNLHGGEPTLRQDLAEICGIIQAGCPRLKRIWISSNGFGTERVTRRAAEILRALDFRKLDRLEINISIDGLGETHDRIRGVPGGFNQCLETVRALLKMSESNPLRVSIGTVIQPWNLPYLDDITELAKSLGVPSFFQPLASDKFFNIRDDNVLAFRNGDKSALEEFVREKLAPGASPTSFYWRDFLGIAQGRKRKSPCAFDRCVLSLYPTGEILPCSQEDWILFGNVYEQPAEKIWFGPRAREIRRRMKKEVCPTCPSYCGVEFSLRKEFFTYAAFYVKEKILRKA